MPMSIQDYALHVDAVYQQAVGKQANGTLDVKNDIIIHLDLGRDNKKLRDFAITFGNYKAKDFDAEMRIQNTIKVLGILPTTPAELVAQIVKNLNITAKYNGHLRKDEVPWILDINNDKQYIPPNLWDHLDFRSLINTKFRCAITIDELSRIVRTAADENKLAFSIPACNDASDTWYLAACTDRLYHIIDNVLYGDYLFGYKQAQADMRVLAETCFDCEFGADFVVAVFNKFIYQVKRKLRDLPVYDHLMMVILGTQGCGKSTLVRKMIEPLHELFSDTDFRAMVDDRNIQLWRNYILFLDEMSYAAKSDLESVKHAITAETLSRRPMRSGNLIHVPQRATFIGTANAENLKMMIRDTSGMRRFGSLTMKDKPNHAIINEMDWMLVWQSVDENGVDPMTPFKAQLAAKAATDRTKIPVEEWLDDLDPAKAFGGELKQGRTYTSEEMYNEFRLYENIAVPGGETKGTSLWNFRQDIYRLSMRAGAKFRVKKIHTANNYEWMDRWLD